MKCSFSPKAYRIYRFDDEHKIIAVKKSGVDELEEDLNDSGVPFEVLATDFQKVIDAENPPKAQIERLQRQNREHR